MPPVQRKAAVSSPGDPLEREADEVADRVMRMAKPGVAMESPTPAQPGGGLQRKCARCAEEEEDQLHRKADGSPAGHTAVPPVVHDVLRSPGQPLDAATRAFMEPRFGHDFSRVRVHADARAAASARAVNALAYTYGRDIVFDAGRYAPGSTAGQHLLAHELAHVLQQRGRSAPTVQRHPADPATCKERCEPEFNRCTNAASRSSNPMQCLAVRNECYRGCEAPQADAGSPPAPAQEPAQAPAQAPAPAPAQAPAEPGGSWTPPAATSYPAESMDPRVIKATTVYKGNPPPPVGWKYLKNKKISPQAKAMADRCKKKETEQGTFVQLKDGDELVAVRCEWHNFTTLWDKEKKVWYNKEGCFKSGSLFLPIAPAGAGVQRKALGEPFDAADVSRRGEPLEREADRVADAVVGMRAPAPAGAAERGAAGSAPALKAPPEPVAQFFSRSSGRPFDAAERAYFEPRFGCDFSRVRIHADAGAAESAASLRARAYTFGNHIVFGAGEYTPGPAGNRRLVAHELAHVVQQRRQPAIAKVQREDVPNDPYPGTGDGEQPGMFSLSDEGFEFLKRHEGVKLKLYNDSQGHCTIGIGHLVHSGNCNGSEPANFKAGITEDEADALFRTDLDAFTSAVANGVTSRLNQYYFDALVSFAFNVGTGAFAGSGVLREVNAKNYSKVPGELMKWLKPPEIKGRRTDEANLFRTGQYS